MSTDLFFDKNYPTGYVSYKSKLNAKAATPNFIRKMLLDFVLTDMDEANQEAYFNSCDFILTPKEEIDFEKPKISVSMLQHYDTCSAFVEISVNDSSEFIFTMRIPYMSVYEKSYVVRNVRDSFRNPDQHFETICLFDYYKIALYLKTNIDPDDVDVSFIGRFRHFCVPDLVESYLKIVHDVDSNSYNDIKLLFDHCGTPVVKKTAFNVCMKNEWTEMLMIVMSLTKDDSHDDPVFRL